MSILGSINDHITHYSEQIRKDSKHLQEVTVGGEVKRIIPPVLKSENTLFSFYVLEVDDGVGSLYVYVSPLMMSAFPFLEIGAIVSVDGYVNALHRNMNNQESKERTIVGFSAKLLKKDESIEERTHST